MKNIMSLIVSLTILLTTIWLGSQTNHAAASSSHPFDAPIFDTHVHYKEPAWSIYSPEDIIALMQKSGVTKALVSSTPDEGTRMLYREDPERIIPFLRPYHDGINSSNWYHDDSIIDYFHKRLEMKIYRGLGEFHIHAPLEADSPVIQKTVKLAVELDLYIHLHSNHVAVEKIFAYEPRVKILWAHAGMSDPPAVVSEMFDRFENLWVDISIREYEIAPNNIIDPEWKKLFLKHSDRITVGSDTWINAQWDNYEEIINFDRNWLGQLPRDVAEKIAFGNAKRLFD